MQIIKDQMINWTGAGFVGKGEKIQHLDFRARTQLALKLPVPADALGPELDSELLGHFPHKGLFVALTRLSSLSI
jgi:hypothetical protein